MKKLLFLNEEYQAEQIIKTEDSIVGKDKKGNEVFAFKGIKNFSVFTLKDDDFDIELTDEQQLLSTVLLENAEIKAELKDQQELYSKLVLEIAEIKGGNASV